MTASFSLKKERGGRQMHSPQTRTRLDWRGPYQTTHAGEASWHASYPTCVAQTLLWSVGLGGREKTQTINTDQLAYDAVRRAADFTQPFQRY